MENRLENALPFEDDTRTCGKIVGSIGILFNIFGLILLFCYGATILSIILSLIFWIFAASFILSILWIFGMAFNIIWFLVAALLLWIIQFCYCIYLAVIFIIALVSGGVGIGGVALMIFIFILGIAAIGLSGVYFYYAMRSFIKMTTLRKTRMNVTYQVSSTEHDGQTERHYEYSEVTERH